MKVEHLLLSIVSLIGLISCDSADNDAPIINPTESHVIESKTALDASFGFHAESASPMTCTMILAVFEDKDKDQDELRNLTNNCGVIDKNGLAKFNPKITALISNVISCQPISQRLPNGKSVFKGWFHISPTGYGRGHKETYDNDCDRWEWLPGVAKTYIGGQLAYMDQSLAIVHQTEFPFGENFDKSTNLAIVCTEKPTKRLGPHKEHFAYLGGKCGQINLDFEVVTPIQQPFEDFQPLPQWAKPFYTRRTNFKVKAGHAEQLKLIMEEAFENLQGLTNVNIHIDPKDKDSLIVYERWESRAAHSASLETPKVKHAIAEGRSLIESIKHQRESEYDPENDKY